MGFFPTLIDMYQTEYGWSDEVVLNLTLRRAVQIKESIEQRRELLKWEQYKLLEWQTQILATMVANTVEDNKARKTLVEYAGSISLTKASNSKSGGKGKSPRTYKTVDGKVISATELSEYTYDEIDHTEENQMLIEHARKKNAGTNLSSMGGMFTK